MQYWRFVPVALLVLIHLISPSPGRAESAELIEAFERYRALHQQGLYREAEPFALEALQLGEAELGSDHPTTATLMSNLAGLYHVQGRYAEAEPLYQRALAIGEQALGPDHPDLATTVNNLAGLYRALDRDEDALPLYQRALGLRERALGPDHPHVAATLAGLAALHEKQGRLAEAEPLFQRVIGIKERDLGPDHPDVATALHNLATFYVSAGRYGEVEPLLVRALGIYQTALGPEHLFVATVSTSLGRLQVTQGRYAAAEPHYRRALAIREQTLGPNHRDVAITLTDLGTLHGTLGRHEDAEPLFRRALAIMEKTKGPDHPDVVASLSALAGLHRTLGRYGAAEALYQRALTITETSFGPDHPAVANALRALGELSRLMSRYAEAEPLFQRALTILEKAQGPSHPDVAATLFALAQLYRSQGRAEDAGRLYLRALSIYEQAFGLDHPSVVTTESALGVLYRSQGRLDDAAWLLERTLTMIEKSFGPEHPRVATAVGQLASIRQKQRQFVAAEALYLQAQRVEEAVFGPEHSAVAATLHALATLYRIQGRYAEAEILFQRSLAIREQAFGADHPAVVSSLNNLAVLQRHQGKNAAAVDYFRRATEITQKRAAHGTEVRSTGGISELRRQRIYLRVHIATLALLASEPEIADTDSLHTEAFEVAQLARANEAATAVARMAARFAAGTGGLAETVRSRQDALDRWRLLDEQLLDALSSVPAERDRVAEARLRAELAAIDTQLEELDAELSRTYPGYAELADPAPLTIAEAQALLGPDEALLAYAIGEGSSVLFALRHDDASVHRLDVGSPWLSRAVTRLRASLDPTRVSSLDQLRDFEASVAAELYEILVVPAESTLDGADHVFIVPDQALESLPFGVLITGEAPGSFPAFEDFRTVSWLAKQYAMTVLPSVSSLRALRRFARASQAGAPFLGIGDPLLKDHPGDAASPSRNTFDEAMFRGVPSIETADLFRGTLGNVRQLREISSLPETAGELAAMAESLGAGPEAIYVRERALEETVRTRLPLADYRVVAFATHGVVAGELGGVAEPALILTPPEEASPADDGLLTAREIALLSLDSDWVILSACNTAAADGTPGAEGLSGLAKAFFYAGTRALLVSHWAVVSDSTVKLTTHMLREFAEHPELGRAEVHRRAILALMNDSDNEIYAHPMFWAPFVVVGEGGTFVPGTAVLSE